MTMYLVKIPTINGADLMHRNRSTAEREVRAAAKHGHAAEIVEIIRAAR